MKMVDAWLQAAADGDLRQGSEATRADGEGGEHDRLQASFLAGLRSSHRWRCVADRAPHVQGLHGVPAGLQRGVHGRGIRSDLEGPLHAALAQTHPPEDLRGRPVDVSN